MKQQKWDEFETALLIDLFWKIEEQPSKKKELISCLSNDLRKRAINKNIEIDDNFRNVNGITMQLISIGHYFFPYRPTLTGSAMFEKVTDIYKNDKNAFDDLLLVAKKEVQTPSSITEDDKDNQNRSKQSIDDALQSIDDYFDSVTKQYSQIYRNVDEENEKNQADNDPLFYDVYKIIAESKTGIKAKAISKKLRVHKKIINSILYRNKNKVFEMDSNYTWSLKNKNTNHVNNALKTISGHFSYGINIDSQIELLRFEQFYNQDHNEKLSLSDDELKKTIKDNCLEYNGKYYYLKENEKEAITKEIENQINNGFSLFYYEELLKKNESWMFDYHIADSIMLKKIIADLFPSFFYKKNYFSADGERTTEIRAVCNEINKVWGDNITHTVDEIKNQLEFIPEDKIKFSLSVCDDFIWNSVESYANRKRIIISDPAIERIKERAIYLANENNSVSFSELPISDIKDEYYELSETALYDFLFSFLSDTFSRNGKVLYFKEDIRSTDEIIRKYCECHDTCTIDELKAVMASTQGDVRLTSLIEAVSMHMVRVDKDQFVSDKLVEFDSAEIDQVLDSIIDHEGIGLKEITTFAAFPFCGYPWNLFLLESYCRRFSKKFKYSCVTTNSQNGGAIIRKTCNMSYKDFMALSIARSNVNLNEKDVYDYLSTTGLIARRSYSEIDDLIDTAKKLRKEGE